MRMRLLHFGSISSLVALWRDDDELSLIRLDAVGIAHAILLDRFHGVRLIAP